MEMNYGFNHHFKRVLYPLDLREGTFVFIRKAHVWYPGKILQIQGPHNVDCYNFIDHQSIVTSKNMLTSFLNYGCSVDFTLLDMDEKYQEGIVDSIHCFAELYSPNLLIAQNKRNVLLDWARQGFDGCVLLTKDDESDTPSRKRKLNPEIASSPHKSGLLPKRASYEADYTEIGLFVFGKLPHYGWWPGLIADPRKRPYPRDPDERLVNWFGDCTKSLIEVKDLRPFCHFSKLYQPSRKGLYRVALYDVLSDVATSCNFSQINAPDSVNIDEAALSKLIDWAMNGFPPCGPPTEWRPTDSYFYREITSREIAGNEEQEELDRNTHHDSCVGCQEKNNNEFPHPLFNDCYYCSSCMEFFLQCIFLFCEDASGYFCCICNNGGDLFTCEDSQCGRRYCKDCVLRVGGREALDEVQASQSWLCVLCSDSGKQGRLSRREDWQEQLHKLLTSSQHGDSQVPLPPPAADKRPIRVLSLFDGISTGLLALQSAGLQIGKYYASEIDEEAINVSHVHHPHVIQIGDTQDITPQKIRDIGPIDLVIGGSPCNELSIANPLRKGIYEGTGRLFFEYFRVLNDVREACYRSGGHVFFLFENVVTMTAENRKCISRFLKTDPVTVNARELSCMNRSRLFWGNVPGMSRSVYPLPSDRLTLQECLEPNCSRIARFEKINCITTSCGSIRQGGTLPVEISGSGDGDWLWCTEIERVFGFEPHYTDIANMSRNSRQRLLGKAWSVPTLRHLFSPLREYFKIGSQKPDVI